jgi:hypothetical protein
MLHLFEERTPSLELGKGIAWIFGRRIVPAEGRGASLIGLASAQASLALRSGSPRPPLAIVANQLE